MFKEDKKVNSLYVHIPFCNHICEYCDFVKLIYNEEFAKDYVDSLIKEIRSYNIDKVNTIYIGGGTPTSLNIDLFEKVLSELSPKLNDGGEFTCEANVESLNKDKLLLLKKYGVNRLSIGVESTHDDLLKFLGRHHTFSDVKTCIKLAKEIGFKNINVDLIYGYKGHTLKLLKEDLDNILSLDTPHISIYSLIVDKGSIFYNKGITEQDSDESREYYDLILKTLREHGYKRYEISNFAKPGYESRHNLTYWRDEEYYGVGLGANGYLNGERYANSKSLYIYNKEYKAESEVITDEMAKEEFLLTNLRLEDGFLLPRYKDRFGIDFLEEHKEAISKLVKNGYAFIDENNFRLTDDGLMIIDSLILDLFNR